MQISADSEVPTPDPVLALTPDIRADSNRDGAVDIKDDTDLADKLEWSDTKGAIFLANIGDTDRRCSKLALAGEPWSDEALAACHDASDDIQRSPQYLAPLRTVPLPGLDEEAFAMILVEEEIARQNVRIFRKEDQSWTITPNDHRFTKEELEKGLVLGIDARDTRRPGGWNGTVQVKFFVQNGKSPVSDMVHLRVAPILTHHHLQPMVKFLSTAGNESDSPAQYKFVHDVKEALKTAGVPQSIFLFDHSDDIWAQDFLEPGYASMPGPDGPRILRVMIRSSQGSRVAGRQVFEYMRDTGRGAVYSTGGMRYEINSMGNLETIPPYESYTAGRIIEGSHGDRTPHVLEYMRAQEFQNPLALDTDWLAVGHVDEFVQFLPSKTTPRGWVMAIADPVAGIEILKQAVNDGHGDSPAFSRPSGGPPNVTIKELLARPGLLQNNTKFAENIKRNRELLIKEIGLAKEEIHDIPLIFETGVCWEGDEGNPPEKNCSPNHGAALYPGVINGVVLSDTQYLAPNPWGPVIDGRDILVEATNRVYGEIGLKVTYIDDWESHHIGGGEVHCGSNTIRKVTSPWWNPPQTTEYWNFRDEL
ncbi:protein-arginine deiminase domain-containing protein [Aspergillus tanneri]|uniref:Protein-arginine deiminase C-terminal domain-containing protein n=1 Tax=Aspergillus tanneri TaxID=1220188 RepID=A0A5M9MIV3_9EURO|nr:uncharacterized protein ATNIH1004_005603 [Aspergillus tanneri]KAA8646928.1 hypothetical protein ATNIH1004_005603 [Aspergillus tanneri]